VNPDLESVISSQFLDMSNFIQGLINQPPPSVNLGFPPFSRV
jgi:hypothetical protein